ncbi:immunoglobulin-like domain-containing protein [Pontibacter sp. H259]|uniref:immunoglobulin-like domain-containing protein n=1 Tax=Pontibacter sp. H259 TaxID=3133421 RepID=UPI0030BF23AE
MKKNKILYIFTLFAASLFLSCEKDTEGISRTTFFPVFAMEGEQFSSVLVGESFTDPGVTATEGEETTEVTTSGTVDTSTPGVYVITYSATNKDGFTVTTNRYVGVIDPAVANVDLSGQYKRNAGALGVSTVIKIGTGHYTADNVGGVAVPGPGTTIHFFNTEGTTLIGPPQEVAGGQVFSIEDGSYVPQGNTASQYSWIVINPGYGAALRTFVRI